MHESEKWKWRRSVMSDSSRPHGLQATRLLYPWDFPGKSTRVGCHCLLQYQTIILLSPTSKWFIIILKLLGLPVITWLSQVLSIKPTTPKYFPTHSPSVPFLILFWKGDYSPCPMGIIYDNHIIFSLEDCSRLIGLSTLWEFKCFQKATF